MENCESDEVTLLHIGVIFVIDLCTFYIVSSSMSFTRRAHIVVDNICLPLYMCTPPFSDWLLTPFIFDVSVLY